MNTSMSIRVLLADDHEMVRQGLIVSLLTFDDIDVVGEAATGIEAVQLCAQLRPDVLLMDLVMPEMDGLEATRQIKEQYPNTQIIALTSYYEKERIETALKAGAIGYLLKDVSLDELANAIRAARAGKPTLAPEVTQTLMESFTQSKEPPPGQNLTPREREVLTAMARGLSNPQIAKQLGVSRSTINTHVSNILEKLNVTNRLEAVTLAIRHNLVTLPRDSSST